MTRLQIFLAGVVLVGISPGEVREAAAGATRNYSLDFRMFSILDGVESVENLGTSSGFGNARLGSGFRIDGKSASVEVSLSEEDGRLFVRIAAEGCGESTPGGQAFPIELEMTDLHAVTLEVARDSEGRQFLVSLTPSVTIHHEPKPLQVTAYDLNLWRLSFNGSKIILNDDKYLGVFGASGGELAFLEVLGLGKVEFSLKPFKGAEPTGSLAHGTIFLVTPDGRKLEITNVTSGAFTDPLPGGPYQVWSRWALTEKTFEEEVQAALAQLDSVLEESMVSLTPEQIEEARERIRKGQAISLGVSGIPRKDLVETDSAR